MTNASSSSTSSSRPRAVVAGGGPSGALAAKVLSERGFDVHLFDPYPRPSSAPATSDGRGKHKAYVISISPRGQSALLRCGVDPHTEIDAAVISEAACRHHYDAAKPKRRAATIMRPDGGKHRSVVARRQALACSLLRSAEKSGATIECGWRVQDVDFEKRIVTLVEGTEKSGGTKERTVGYDLLVGADGTRSKTRNLLANYLNAKGEDFAVKTLDDTMEYQVAVLPRPWTEIVASERREAKPLNDCPEHSIHAWADRQAGTTALGFPLRKSNDSPMDSTLVTVIFPGGVLGELKKSGPNGYESSLSGLFSDWTPESRLELARLLSEPDNVPNIGGTQVWCPALSHPESGVALIGDAGHGMWPSLGQGCNAALESVSVFADAIEAVTGSISSGAGCRNVDFSASSHEELAHAIALEYDGLRHDDALAAVDLTYGGIGGTKVRGAPHSPKMFKLQVLLFMLMSKLTAGLVPMPAMLRIMKGDGAPYSALKRANRVEKYVTYGTVFSLLWLGLRKFL